MGVQCAQTLELLCPWCWRGALVTYSLQHMLRRCWRRRTWWWQTKMACWRRQRGPRLTGSQVGQQGRCCALHGPV